MNSRIPLFLLCCAGFFGIACPRVSAQWLIQNFQLNPGWNAIRLHVDASHDTIANLLGAGGTAPEGWLPNMAPEGCEVERRPERHGAAEAAEETEAESVKESVKARCLAMAL